MDLVPATGRSGRPMSRGQRQTPLLWLLLSLGLFVGVARAADIADVDCGLFAVATAASPTVIVDVPAGSTRTARCGHNAVDAAMRLPSAVPVQVQFRCGNGSTLVLDGWRQLYGSLEVLPPFTSTTLEGVTVETRNGVFLDGTVGHALSFIAVNIMSCSLFLGSGSTIRGQYTAVSFVGATNSTFSVVNSIITVTSSLVEVPLGYGAAAVVFEHTTAPANCTLEMANVTLVANGSVVSVATSDVTTRNIAALGVAASQVSATSVRAEAHASSITAMGTRSNAVVAVGFSVYKSENSTSLDADDVTLAAHHSVVNVIGFYAVASVGCSVYNLDAGRGMTIAVRRSSIRATASNVSVSGIYAVTSVGLSGYCNCRLDRGTNNNHATLDAEGTSIHSGSSNVTAKGYSSVASVGVTLLTETCGVTNTAVTRAAKSVVSADASNVTATGTGVVAAVGFAIGAAKSTFAVEQSQLRANSSNITASGDFWVAAVGFASSGSGSITANDALVSVVSSSVTARGKYDAVASAGIAGSSAVFSGLGSERNITADGLSITVVAATVSAAGATAVASAGIVYVVYGIGDKATAFARAVNVTIVVCASYVGGVGRLGVAAASVVSNVRLIAGHTQLYVSGGSSVLVNGTDDSVGLNCNINDPCGYHSVTGFASPVVVKSVAFDTTRSNTLLVLDSDLFQASPSYARQTSACANLSDASLFGGVLIANTSFACDRVGWAQSGTSVTASTAVVLLARGGNASSFPGASDDDTSAAGHLGTVAEARDRAAENCGWQGQLGSPHDARSATKSGQNTRTVTWSLTRPSARTVSPSDGERANPRHPHAQTASGTEPRVGESTTVPVPAPTRFAQTTSHTRAATITASPPDRTFTASRRNEARPARDNGGETTALAATSFPFVPGTVVAAATGTAALVVAVGGLIGVPVASRPAVVGAAVRLSNCVADGDGPEVPPYDAMPVQFATLDTTLASAGLATTTNALFVVMCIAGGYAISVGEATVDGGGEPSMRASIAHVTATVPLSYVGPALMEFSVTWLSAARDGTGVDGSGPWWICFVAAVGVAVGGWLLLLLQARRWVPPAVPGDGAAAGPAPPASSSDSTVGRLLGVTPPSRPATTAARWAVLVGPLIDSTRDTISPVVRYAFFVELGSGFLFSALSGVRADALCVAKCVSATLVALGFLAYLVVVRPAHERVDHWFGIAFALLQFSTGGLVTAGVLGHRSSARGDTSWPDAVLDAAQTVNLVTLGLLVVQGVVGIVMAVRKGTAERRKVGLAAAATVAGGTSSPLLTVPTTGAPPAAACGGCEGDDDEQHRANSNACMTMQLAATAAGHPAAAPSNPLRRM
jgi:hypothetical protein